ncbi:MAG: FliM/FliN family flagellar motor switch protein, partial [Sedimentisphaerales bacterium]|nr:FliM/FliN family flagellar motor switch protein [Sedimentisphaerales bacterium]
MPNDKVPNSATDTAMASAEDPNTELDVDAMEAEMLAMANGMPSEEREGDKSDKLKTILSMRVPLIVKVAEKKMTMDNILKFSLGSIIQFDKDVYENIELMVNNHAIAVGQPVKIGENFGLRLLQVGNIEKTIKSMG